ncbi:MAG: hypothetical protein SGARI_000929 [Bacillariaceae sp.]
MSFSASPVTASASSIINPQAQIQQQQIMTSLCTQSIVGDENLYDVITLEYESIDQASLTLLAQRLRARFPRAVLIFVKLWSPLDLFYIENTPAGTKEPNVGTVLWSDTKSMVSAMKQHTWILQEDHDERVEQIMSLMNGSVYHMAVPSGINDYLDILPEWFLERHGSGSTAHTSLRYDLSSSAHSMIAKGVEELVQEKITEEVEQSSSSPLQPLFGTWGSGDSCHLWFESGNGLSEQHYSRGLQYKEFSNRYALEVAAPSGGSLQVENPFAEDRMVYLTYMTTSANASSKKVYPRTKLRLDGGDAIVLDPSHDDNRDTSHRTRTSAVGMVRAGATAQLEFTPLEEYTLNKFRIVGLSFLAKEKVTHQIPSEFAMLSAHGLVVEEEEEGGTYTSYGESLLWWGETSETRRIGSSSSSSDDRSSTATIDQQYDQPSKAQFRPTP